MQPIWAVDLCAWSILSSAGTHPGALCMHERAVDLYAWSPCSMHAQSWVCPCTALVSKVLAVCLTQKSALHVVSSALVAYFIYLSIFCVAQLSSAPLLPTIATACGVLFVTPHGIWAGSWSESSSVSAPPTVLHPLHMVQSIPDPSHDRHVLTALT